MSVHVSALLWQIEMPMPTKLVMLKLADNANEDGSNVRPSQNTVAKQCGCSVRTVQRVVQEQVKSGLLVEVPTPGNRVNEYAFDMDAVRQRVRVTHSQGDSQSGLSTTHSQGSTTESHPINKNRPLTVKEPSSKTRPSEEEFVAYAATLDFPELPAREAFAHYELVGWVQGKNHHQIKSWKHAVVTSKTNWLRWQKQNPGSARRKYA